MLDIAILVQRSAMATRFVRLKFRYLLMLQEIWMDKFMIAYEIG